MTRDEMLLLRVGSLVMRTGGSTIGRVMQMYCSGFVDVNWLRSDGMPSCVTDLTLSPEKLRFAEDPRARE